MCAQLKLGTKVNWKVIFSFKLRWPGLYFFPKNDDRIVGIAGWRILPCIPSLKKPKREICKLFKIAFKLEDPNIFKRTHMNILCCTLEDLKSFTVWKKIKIRDKWWKKSFLPGLTALLEQITWPFPLLVDCIQVSTVFNQQFGNFFTSKMH